jgi:hypothetical protein
VRPVPHGGLAEIARLLAQGRDDPAAACREAARACPGAGLADLALFYGALAGGTAPPGVWAQMAPPALASDARPDNRTDDRPPEIVTEGGPSGGPAEAGDEPQAGAAPAPPAPPAARGAPPATAPTEPAEPAEPAEGEPGRTSSTPT